MAKNNFKAKEAVTDPNYAQTAGLTGQSLLGAGAAQAAQGGADLSGALQGQKSFADMLQSAAAGTGGPTLADQAVKDVTARNNANAAGFAASSKGLNPALAARQALMAQSGNNQAEAGQAAQTHIQEQQAARAQLGGALAGEAGTAGAEGSLGLGEAGTGGSIANASNQNLIGSRNAANNTNEKVASENASAINAGIGQVLNAAGGVASMGLAEGGEVPGEPEGTQSDETSIALAKGGAVPAAPALSAVAPKAAGPTPVQPHRSFAAQVAHHLSREYFADGGMASQPAASDASPKTGQQGQVDKEDVESATANLEKDAAKPKEKWGVDLSEKGKATPKKFAEGGEVDEDDDDDEDNEPDTDQAVDENEDREYFDDGGTAGSLTNAKGNKVGKMAGAGGFGQLLGKAIFGGGPKKPDYQGDAQRAMASGPAGTGETPLPTPPPAVAPQGSAHPELADGSGSATPTEMMSQGGDINFKAGGPVPGQAAVQGNSPKNDTVKAMLSPGEVVLPRTISHDPKQAKKFVEHLMGNGGSGPKSLKDIKKRKVA